MRLASFMLVLCAACGGGTSDHSSPDAPAGGGDAPRPDGPATDAPPGTALSRTLYINTEGLTLAPGSDDATMDKTSLISTATTATKWLANDAQRSTKIAALVTQIQTTLAAYNVSIVSTRPAAGPYDMVVITDSTSQSFGFGAGQGGASPVTCSTIPSAISLLFGSSYAGFTDVKLRNTFASYAIAQFGIDAHVPMSAKNQDCMCYAGQSCGPLTGPCTIGGPGTPIMQPDLCGFGSATMDEGAQFLAAWGPHP